MNGTMIQFFHWYSEGNGKLWDEVKNQAQYLQDLGINAVWLPPAYKASGGGYSTGYDPYDLFDLGEFDQKGTIPTKYGTKQQYLDAIWALKEKGVRVIVDIVLNHKAGGDEKERFHAVKVDLQNRQQNISEPYEIEAYTKFTFPGRGTQYSDFQWNFNCFSGVDYAEGEEGNFIYQIINDHGAGWEGLIDDEKGSYDYLMYNDIDHRNPYVREELNYWGKWYHDTVGFDGVMLDAVKHQSPQFYQEWLHTLRANTGENIFAVGEYWEPGHLELLLRYIDATNGSMSLFDSSLHHNMRKASLAGSDYDLRTIFNETLVHTHPQLAVTVVDNHDTQPLQSLEAPIEEWFKPIAYALILLRQDGYPCIFYPDLFGAHYWGYGKDGNEYEIFLNRVDGIEALIIARKEYAYGTQRDYFEDANCLGWTRDGDGEHRGCAVLLSNKDSYEKPMEVGAHYAGQEFHDFLGRFEHRVTIDENGWGNFSCPAGNVSVWVPVS